MESVDVNSNAGYGKAYDVEIHDSAPSILIVCEHASNHIPEDLNNLGVSDEVLTSHVAWDPGALGVARALAKKLPSVLFFGTISRLVYDCNRPPEAASAIPAFSERFEITGNVNLSPNARIRRIEFVFAPFTQGITDQIARHRPTLQLMITIHSFTPVFDGIARSVELGLLHGTDDRFATAMLGEKPESIAYDTRLNEPYSAHDGVAHTLDAHGTKNGLLNVMIEIRNDLIATADRQAAMAERLAPWIKDTLAGFQIEGAAP